jgi:hypothetical protein
MTPEGALKEAWRLYDYGSGIAACALARTAINRAVNRLAKKGRRGSWEVLQTASDLEDDRVITASDRTRIRETYRALTAVVNGEDLSIGDAGELVEKAAKVVARLQEPRPHRRQRPVRTKATATEARGRAIDPTPDEIRDAARALRMARA